MKLVKEHINEKFKEETDPVHSMGIGLINQLKKDYIEQFSYRPSIHPDTITLEQLMSFCLSYPYDLDVIDALIDAGVDINSKDVYFLSIAVRRGKDFVKFMLDKGADPKIGKSFALEIAIKMGDLESAQLLLDHGAKINDRDLLSKALKYISSKTNETVKWLLQHGANPNKYNYRSLISALRSRNYEIADILVDEYKKSRKK